MAEQVIFWQIPTTLATQFSYDKTKIFRSSSENTGYHEIAEIASQDPTGTWITTYTDLNGDEPWYVVALYKSTSKLQSPYIIALRDFTIREKRLVDQVKTSMPPLILRNTTDTSYRQGLQLGVQLFNAVTPITDFTINNFPYDIEALLLIGGQIGAILTNYLPVSFRNIDYSLTGFTLRTRWSEHLDSAVERLTGIFNEAVLPLKMEFGPSPQGQGTFMLPLCIAGENEIFDIESGKFQTVKELYDIAKAPLTKGIKNGNEVIEFASIPYIRGRGKLYTIKFGNKKEITVGVGHQFLTSYGWKKLSELSEGNYILGNECLTYDKKDFSGFYEIKKIIYNRNDIFYDLMVLQSHNYLAEGIYNHNSLGARLAPGLLEVFNLMRLGG